MADAATAVMDREDEVIDEVDEPKAEQLALPTFEGHQPHGATVKFNGTVSVPSSVDAIGYNDEVYFLVKGRVSYIGHGKRGKVGLVREQTVEVNQLLRLDDFEAVGIFREHEPSIIKSDRHRNDDLGDELAGGEDLPVGE